MTRFINAAWPPAITAAALSANGGETSAREQHFNQTGQLSNNERCWDTGVCIAQSGRDQLGLNKVVGWRYTYNPSDNTVLYWNLPPKRVPHKGQPDRYVALNFVEHYYQQPIAATPGYYREITPAKTKCKPNYSGGIWVNGNGNETQLDKPARPPLQQRSGLPEPLASKVVLDDAHGSG